MKRLMLLLVLCASFYDLLAQSKPIEFTEYDLPNGLHVILHPNNTYPVVASTVLYRVGSIDEAPRRTGFAHFFEHLLFEGSENISRGGFDSYMQRAGGEDNGTTTRDETRYYEMLPSNQLGLGLWLESERMLHARIDSVGVNTQRLVVKEERRLRLDNQPYGRVGETLWQAAFPGTPYAWTPFGSMEDLDRATLDEFMDFYRKFYVPDNAVLCISGDIEVDSARQLVEKYFATIPRGSAGPIRRAEWSEVRPEREVRDTLYEDISIPLIVHAYRIPGRGHPDEMALHVLASVLSSGRSSRLFSALLGKKDKALSSEAYVEMYKDLGLFRIESTPSAGVTLADLEKRIDKVVDKLRRQPPSEREIERIRNQEEDALEDDALYVRNAAALLARTYIRYGDTGRVNKRIELLRAVTREDVQRVAAKYLVERNRVKIYDLPKSDPSTAATPSQR